MIAMAFMMAMLGSPGVSDAQPVIPVGEVEGVPDRLHCAGTEPFWSVTIENMEAIFETRMDGFSEVVHRISYDKIGTSTIQSRATGGVVNATFVFALPGSPGACKDGWDGILKQQLDYRHMPCNFVEIMPRLDEHLRRGKS